MSADEKTTNDDPVESSRMSLGEHLDDLRWHLLRAVMGLVVVLAVCGFFHKELADIVLEPHRWTVDQLNEDITQLNEVRLGEDKMDMVSHRPRGKAATSGFFFYFKICFYFALFVAGPYVLWELWQFIAAGLYKREKRVIHVMFPFSALLFLSGVLFGYFKLLPYGYYYMFKLSIEHVNPDVNIEEYLKLVTNLTLALGTVFQLPLVMMILSRVGLVEPKNYSKHRGLFWISSLVIAAVLTPPDPLTQMMMAIPMAFLYELGLLLARVAHRKAIATDLDNS